MLQKFWVLKNKKISIQSIIWQTGPLHLELEDQELDQCTKLQKVQLELEDPGLNLYKNPRLRVQLTKILILLRELLDQYYK